MDAAHRSQLRRTARDPFARSIALSVAMILGGFVAIGLGWRGAADSLLVPVQISFLVSGGLGGLALIVAGAGILSVQSTRYWNARERRLLDQILMRAAAMGGDQLRATVMSRVNAPPK